MNKKKNYKTEESKSDNSINDSKENTYYESGYYLNKERAIVHNFADRYHVEFSNLAKLFLKRFTSKISELDNEEILSIHSYYLLALTHKKWLKELAEEKGKRTIELSEEILSVTEILFNIEKEAYSRKLSLNSKEPMNHILK
ncbi:MAG: hypothetical protein PHY47_00565 [Lachnospiraceae bacterium]|nr:hypothetical protein [Lachnospiraceae bacterium]